MERLGVRGVVLGVAVCLLAGGAYGKAFKAQDIDEVPAPIQQTEVFSPLVENTPIGSLKPNTPEVEIVKPEGPNGPSSSSEDNNTAAVIAEVYGELADADKRPSELSASSQEAEDSYAKPLEPNSPEDLAELFKPPPIPDENSNNNHGFGFGEVPILTEKVDTIVDEEPANEEIVEQVVVEEAVADKRKEVPLVEGSFSAELQEAIEKKPLEGSYATPVAASVQDFVVEEPIQQVAIEEVAFVAPVKEFATAEESIQQVPIKELDSFTAPVKEVATYEEPIQQVPIKELDSFAASVKEVATYEEPIQEAPIKELDSFAAPVKEVATYEEPIQQVPIKELDSFTAPVKEVATAEEPIQQVPIKELDSFAAPVKEVATYEETIQEAPSKELNSFAASVKEVATDEEPIQQVPIKEDIFSAASVQDIEDVAVEESIQHKPTKENILVASPSVQDVAIEVPIQTKPFEAPGQEILPPAPEVLPPASEVLPPAPEAAALEEEPAVEEGSVDQAIEEGIVAPAEAEEPVKEGSVPVTPSPTVKPVAAVQPAPLAGYEVHTTGNYKFHRDMVTWQQAKEACEEEGAHLAVVNSKAESKVLKKMFQEFPDTAWMPKYRKVIFASVGFHDMDTEGEYVTIFGAPLNSTGFTRFWRKSEPNNLGASETRPGEDCGAIHRNGGLNDFFCMLYLPFFCEQ